MPATSTSIVDAVVEKLTERHGMARLGGRGISWLLPCRQGRSCELLVQPLPEGDAAMVTLKVGEPPGSNAASFHAVITTQDQLHWTLGVLDVIMR